MRKRKRYFKDGELRQKISYDKKEKKHGKYIVYSKVGLIVLQGKYKHGERIGRWVFKNDSGKIFSIKKYKKGKLVQK